LKYIGRALQRRNLKLLMGITIGAILVLTATAGITARWTSIEWLQNVVVSVLAGTPITLLLTFLPR
jgi:hypothetical protein